MVDIKYLELPLVFVALVYILSARYYASAPVSESCTVAQISIEDFNPSLIRTHRIPYIINERLPDLSEFMTSVFRYEYICKKVREETNVAFRCGAMFTLIHATEDVDDQEVSLSHPRNGKSIVNVKLSKGRLIILPPRWLARVNSTRPKSINIYELYDPACAIATLLGSLVW